MVPLHRMRSVTHSLPLEDVEKALIEGDLECVPVLAESGEPIGIISRTDLLRQKAYYPSLNQRMGGGPG